MASWWWWYPLLCLSPDQSPSDSSTSGSYSVTFVPVACDAAIHSPAATPMSAAVNENKGQGLIVANSKGLFLWL